jgi:DNA-binding CsgD family transcriptional regulator/N-acetylneuraminic acid mutarotase
MLPVTDEQLATLSERELEILRLVATGATNGQIARELFISPNTVKVHLRNIFSKLGVDSRTEATMIAVRRGWVTLPEGVLAGAPAAPGTNGAAAEPAPAVARLVMPRGQRVYLLAAALLSLALLYATWPKVEACSPSAASERCPPAASALEDSRWATRVNMPTARGRLALVAVPEGRGGRLYAIGGETGTGISDAVEIFDPAENAWRAGEPIPLAVANVGAVLVDGLIYLPGGLTAASTASDVLAVYDPEADAWTEGPALPAPRFGYALAVWDGRLYLFGGSDGQRYVADTFVYDPSDQNWSTRAPLPAARAFAAAGAFKDQVVVVGGYDGEQEFDRCDRYDPAADSWSPCAPLQLARGGIGAAVVLEDLYVVGGGWTRMLALSERYDPVNDIWHNFESPYQGEWRSLAVAALGGDLYAAGGYDGNSYLGTLQQYQPLFRLYLPTTKH